MVRCWSPTISPGPCIGSRTRDVDRLTTAAPGLSGAAFLPENAMRIPRFARLAALAAAALAVASQAQAADVKAGRQKALQCQTCHGLDGLSKIPEAPHLA